MSELGIGPGRLDNGHAQYSTTGRARSNCHCCPYGYHIDLGFVDFCERLARHNAEASPIKTERRQRRRQRKSMDVLLGITNPTFWNLQQFLPSSPDVSLELIPGISTIGSTQPLTENDGLNKAVEDFEATLERAKKAGCAPEISKIKDTSFIRPAPKRESQRSPDAVELSTSTADAVSLKTIREQVAQSLEKMREMENKVKILPALKNQILCLETDKASLLSKIAELTHSLTLKKSEIEKLTVKRNNEKKVVSRDVCVLCVPQTRDIGVASMATASFHKNVSTETKVTSTTDQSTLTDSDTSVATDTSSISLKDLDSVKNITIDATKRIAGTQTTLDEVRAVSRDVGVQNEPKVTRDMGVNSKPKMISIGDQTNVSTRDIGVSQDTIIISNCDRCSKLQTKSIGIGYGNVKEPVFNSSLVNRSKSFDLSNQKRTRSIGVQTIPAVRKLTATKQVGTVEKKPVLKHAAINTVPTVMKDISTFVNIDEAEEKPIIKEKHGYDVKCKEVPQASKIPRPMATPVMNRKILVRQDTYSKSVPIGTASPIPSSSTVSRLSSSPEKSDTPVENEVKVVLRKKKKDIEEAVTELDAQLSSDLNLKEKRASVASTSDRYSALYDDGAYDYDEQYGDQESNRNSQFFQDSALFQPIQEKPREKLTPSKEMKAAMKVVNDGLFKYPDGLPNHLKTASNIIQKEWFQISSTASAIPHDVEDYLDSFEEMSNILLEFVVNLVDNNGNTAMHYAVSHGNFDVVSILLDSKVCNINKPNAAGYTCVMLVSLAEVRSDTHRQVVRRLFLLADVNVRAKQHGQTALMLAVSHGRLDMVQLLLEAGADPNIQDCDGSTALMCAAEHGHLEIVKQILAHPDCDPSIVDCDGSSALAIAMEAGNRDIGVLLYAREHFAPNSRGSSPYTSLKHKHRNTPRPTSSPHPRTPTEPGPNKKMDQTS